MDGRRLRGDLTRAKVIESSVTQASELGLEGLTLNSVAEGAGVSKATVSQLFGSKEGVQLATLDAAMDRFRQRVGSATQSIKSPSKKVEGLFGQWFLGVQQRETPGGCFMHATLSEFRCRPGAIHERTKEYRLAWRSNIRGLLKEALRNGEFKPEIDVEQLAFDLFACQAAADTALFYDDADTFNRARKSVARHLKAARRI